MERPANTEPAPVLSPQRLAESYNPSIGSAGGSSQVARRGTAHPAYGSCWQAKMSAPQAGCSGKTAWPSVRCGENTAVLCVGHLAGYHPVSSFAVQLSIQEPVRGRGSLIR